MKSMVVVGAQWGDEGKGKVVDYLAGSFDYIARVAGGHNAGHTVIIGKDRYVLQLIPCGILRPKQQAVIGTGVVVDPAALVAEIETLAKAGIDVKGRLHRQQSRALDFSVSPGDGQSGGRRARRGQNWHDFARNRSGVRRQNGAARFAHVRFAGAGAISQEGRARGGGEKPAGERRVRRRHRFFA